MFIAVRITIAILLLFKSSCGQTSTQCLMKNFSVSSQNGSDALYCTDPSTNTPCATLSYLIQHVTDCANIRILDNQTLINSIHFGPSSRQLVIQGNRQMTVIRCENNSGVFFNSSQQIHIENLHFIGCSMKVASFLDADSAKAIDPALTSSVTFYRSHDIRLAECAFSNTQGSALLLVDTNKAAIKESNFTGAGHIIADQARSGGIVIRRQLPIVEDFSYIITNCYFSANLNRDLKSNSSCTYSDPQESIGLGGAVDVKLLTQNSTTNISIQDSHFHSNQALYGGAVCMSYSGFGSRNLIDFIRCSFEANLACAHGGAISVRTDTDLEDYDQESFGQISLEDCSFHNNSGLWGGAISVKRCRPCGDIVFSATGSNWTYNNAFSSGYAVAIGGNQTDTEPRDRYAIKKFHVDASFSDCNFINNTNVGHFQNLIAIGALALTSTELTLSGSTLFNATHGTALLLKTLSRATFAGSITFSHNFGINGGAVHLVAGSYIRLNSTANVLFEANHAVVRGGAVYSQQIAETYGQPAVPCLLQLDDFQNATVTFNSNFASNVDQALYIGNPGQCDKTVLKNFNYSPSPFDDQIQTPADIIEFTTTPEIINNTLSVMLGETFYLKPNAKGKFGNNSPSFGYLALLARDGKEYSDKLNYSLAGPISLGIDTYTHNNKFFIYGPNNESTIVLDFLYDQVSTYRSGSTQLEVRVVSCKIGYYYSQSSQKCECVNSSSLICHERTVCLQQGYWYDQEKKLAVPCPARNCDYATGGCPKGTQECPRSPGYCSITSPDDVCREGRGNYLCSECDSNHTFSFEAFHCASVETCKTQNTVFIIMGILAYWCVFIVGLLVILTLQLQVGSGFMFGVVYYFSVVSLFTDTIGKNPFLQVIADICISMTQLDPRIVTEFLSICFVKDLNALHHLMLHYITPVFIIGMITIIILLSRHCRCPKPISLAENSPIHAICMLILFSYASLSHTSFYILRPIVIGGSIRAAAVPERSYFDPIYHLPFALFALLLELLVTLPTCVLFVFAPCFSKKINFVKWRLKPILDEFQACYRPECRWFAGFYFLARQLMYLSAIIPQHDLPQSNLLVQCVSAAILLVHTSFQPYKKRWLNLLDTILLADILLFSVYASASDGPLQITGINRFIYDAAPYVLFLFPACYMFLVLAVLVFKRFYKWCQRLFLHRRRASSNAYFAPTATTVGLDAQSTSSYNTEEREPLLADNCSVQRELYVAPWRQ